EAVHGAVGQDHALEDVRPALALPGRYLEDGRDGETSHSCLPRHSAPRAERWEGRRPRSQARPASCSSSVLPPAGPPVGTVLLRTRSSPVASPTTSPPSMSMSRAVPGPFPGAAGAAPTAPAAETVPSAKPGPCPPAALAAALTVGLPPLSSRTTA